jgi:hypothetical protein
MILDVNKKMILEMTLDQMTSWDGVDLDSNPALKEHTQNEDLIKTSSFAKKSNFDNAGSPTSSGSPKTKVALKEEFDMDFGSVGDTPFHHDDNKPGETIGGYKTLDFSKPSHAFNPVKHEAPETTKAPEKSFSEKIASKFNNMKDSTSKTINGMSDNEKYAGIAGLGALGAGTGAYLARNKK